MPWRTILRHRNELAATARQHVPDMHKALTQMNLQIHEVISDITAVTGLAIVDAILGEQRDGVELATLRDAPIKADTETIVNRLSTKKGLAEVRARTLMQSGAYC